MGMNRTVFAPPSSEYEYSNYEVLVRMVQSITVPAVTSISQCLLYTSRSPEVDYYVGYTASGKRNIEGQQVRDMKSGRAKLALDTVV